MKALLFLALAVVLSVVGTTMAVQNAQAADLHVDQNGNVKTSNDPNSLNANTDNIHAAFPDAHLFAHAEGSK